ncbi:MAG: SDR family NAD(P)-dependent oxidoreductase [Pseudomonadota bacterium]
MESFEGRLAVITGAGSGMGRELAVQLARAGCHLGLCDVSWEDLEETRRLCGEDVRVSVHLCDVSDEAAVTAFRDGVLAAHETDHVHLLFNNAGIGGGGSFLEDPREEWERTFGVCWFGVYFCCRAFMPLLVAAEQGHVVNTSSVNGFWASLGPEVPHTAYSAAKFAVKGFSEALINDLRMNAPHVQVSVVMPGHIGTSIAFNTGRVLRGRDSVEMTAGEVAHARARMVARGLPVDNVPDDHIRDAVRQQAEAFRDNAPLTAAQAAEIILDGVREGRWRILVGEDAQALDEAVRAAPEACYEPDFTRRIQSLGFLGGEQQGRRPRVGSGTPHQRPRETRESGDSTMSSDRFDHWQPITASDAEIERALEHAHIPSLMASLVHLTGDEDLIHGDIRPSAEFFGDPQAGITEEQQARVRALALDALRTYRDAGCPRPPEPPEETVRDMMSFVAGEELPEEYGEFLISELSLRGEDPFGQPIIDEAPVAARERFNVVVIGAGMSGILAAIRLQEAGIPYVVVEKNADVGGTWLENTYPGCRVDSPNHTYSYSFEPNDWPQHFSNQQTLLSYFQRVATEYGIRDAIRFNTEVEEAAFDEATGTWRVSVAGRDGRKEVLEANAVISAVGQLNRPRLPDVPGRDSFRGPAFHSARWDHDVSLEGKRVAVIGTGASAFQFVPRVAEQASEVAVFQRTPPWMSPTPEYFEEIPSEKHWLLNHVPYYAKWYRFWMFWRTAEGLLPAARRDPAWNDQERSVSALNDELRQMLTEYVRELCDGDDDLFEKSIPDYPPAGKRMLRDDGTYLRALQRDNVELITDPVAEITETGLVTESGRELEVDVIIYGTGFQADKFLWPMKIYGRGGRELHEQWNGDPRAYLGITVPGFPNLFCCYGPNTNIVVNGSIIFFSECEVRYILGCIGLLLQEGHAAIDCRPEVHDAYNREIDAANAEMAWGVPNVDSWYKNDQGRVTQNWPFSLLEFWERTRAPDPEDFVFLDADAAAA